MFDLQAAISSYCRSLFCLFVIVLLTRNMYLFLCRTFRLVKLNLNIGGWFDHCIGGFGVKGMVIDPDYLPWSVFENFYKNHKVHGSVLEISYKFPGESVTVACFISED